MQPDTFWQSLCLVFLFIALLADCFITRWGVWVYGAIEKNPLIRNQYYDLTKSGALTFLDAMIRLGLVILIAVLIRGLGIEGDHYWYVPLIFSVPSSVYSVKGILTVLRLRAKNPGWK